MGDISPQLIAKVFQLLKQRNGVTLAAAIEPRELYGSAIHHAIYSQNPYHVSLLLSEPNLNEGWSTIDDIGRTPLHSALHSGSRNAPWTWVDCLGPQIVAVMTDKALNKTSYFCAPLLWLAIRKKCFSILRCLLLRPALKLNTTRSVRNAIFDDDRQTVISIFDEAARHFAPVVLTIRDAFYNSNFLNIDLPICTIIYHYYRIPYPRCECDPALAASAPTKHSPFWFCFPS